jgi:hypothetical protein
VLKVRSAGFEVLRHRFHYIGLVRARWILLSLSLSLFLVRTMRFIYRERNLEMLFLSSNNKVKREKERKGSWGPAGLKCNSRLVIVAGESKGSGSDVLQ